MYLEGDAQGRSALIDYLVDGPVGVPDDVLARLRELARPATTASSCVACVEAVELIYARQGDLPPPLLALGADLAEMCARHDFHGLGAGGRGLGIATALRKIDGVAAKPKAPRGKAPEPRDDLMAAAGEGCS